MSADAQATSHVELAVENQIAIVTLNRPAARNAISDAMRAELIEILDRLAGDDGVRAVVLTGKDKAFCAGGDITGMQERLKAPAGEIAFNGWRRQKRTHQGIAAIHGMGKPTIAAVNGPAMGLGCDMALACDFIIASETAVFSMSFIRRGLVPDGGGMYFLPRRIGLSRAKELIFTGRQVGAEEALTIGLADRMTTSEKLVADACQWASELSQGSTAALALCKSVLDKTFELSDDQVFALGREAQAICYTTAEHQESVAAFLNKKSR